MSVTGAAGFITATESTRELGHSFMLKSKYLKGGQKMFLLPVATTLDFFEALRMFLWKRANPVFVSYFTPAVALDSK